MSDERSNPPEETALPHVPKGHRLFAAFCDWTSRHEGPRQQSARQAVMRGVQGRVLELGVGVGNNWQYLPEGVQYSGVDPDPYMFERARKRAVEEARDVDLHQAPAEALPFPDHSFDTVVVTLTLCTIPDVPRALTEVRRVLKPGGELHFWEHVRPAGAAKSRIFDLMTPAWRYAVGGCNPNRDTAAAIARAGFEMRELHDDGSMSFLPVIRGVAVVP